MAANFCFQNKTYPGGNTLLSLSAHPYLTNPPIELGVTFLEFTDIDPDRAPLICVSANQWVHGATLAHTEVNLLLTIDQAREIAQNILAIAGSAEALPAAATARANVA